MAGGNARIRYNTMICDGQIFKFPGAVLFLMAKGDWKGVGWTIRRRGLWFVVCGSASSGSVSFRSEMGWPGLAWVHEANSRSVRW